MPWCMLRETDIEICNGCGFCESDDFDDDFDWEDYIGECEDYGN